MSKSKLSKDVNFNADQTEVLFLLSKLLSSLVGFENSAAAIKDDLNSSLMMGQIIGWNGESRKTDLKDMENRHPNILPNHIISHLENSLASVKASCGNGIVPSLLHQFTGVYNSNDVCQQAKFREVSLRLSDVLLNLRNLNNKKGQLLNRKQQLVHELGVITSFSETSNLSSSAGNIFDITGDNEVVPVLREIGKTNEITKINTAIESINAEVIVCCGELSTVMTSLSHLGCLTSSVTRGVVDTGLCWINNRSLGLTGRGLRNGGRPSLGGNALPSAMRFRSALTDRLKVQWTVSGHMMNPAYCATFDQTGQFLLTGADDYLVKIWHAERGQLLRTCRGHMAYVSILAVSPCNSLFASACTLGSVRVWRMRDGLCLAVFKHNASVNWLKFDPATGNLASTSDDGQCMVWDLSLLLPREEENTPYLKVLLGDDKYGDALLRNIPTRPPSTIGSTSHGDFYALRREPEMIDGPSTESEELEEQIVNKDTEAKLSRSVQRRDTDREGMFLWSRREKCTGSQVRRTALDNNGSSSSNGNHVVDLMDEDEEEDESVPAQRTHLVLPHIPDVFVGGGDADAPLKVLCLDISPTGNVLVTGCEDGVARVWRFGDQDGVYVNKTANGGVAHSTRATAGTAHKLRPMETALQSLESLVSVEEFAKMSLVARHMLQRLEGHVSPVTDIRLSSLGDRLVTGSAQDGSVRIWSLSRDYLKCTHIVLNLAEEDDEVAQSFQTRVRGKNVRSSKSQVYNVGWTTDDQRVVTIQSVPSMSNLAHMGSGTPKNMTRLKVWDSMTGDLLRVIWSVSVAPCSVLLLHPLDPQIALTAGEDGLISVWNLDLECNISRCSLLYDDGTPAHVVDASYSPDGTRVVATDMIGRVTYLSLDDPSRYRGSVLTEQYFSTDYANILLDDNGFAIDEGTQLPVQEAPVGLLCRLDGSAYETQPSPTSFASYPPPLSCEEVRARLDSVIDLGEQLGRTMDRSFAVFSRNKNRGRVSKKYRSNKTARPRGDQMSGFSSSPATRNRYKEFDLSQYQPSSDDSALDSDWDRVADEQERRRVHNSSGGAVTSRVRSSRVSSNSLRRDGNIHDLRSARSSGSHRSGGGGGGGFGGNVHSFSSLRRSSRSRGGSNVSYSDLDNESDHNIGRNASSGRAQRAAQRSEKRSRLATVRNQDEDDDSGDTEELLDEEGEEGSSTDSELGEERAQPTRRSQRQKKRPSRGHGSSSSSRLSSRNAIVVRSDDEDEAGPNSYVPVRKVARPRGWGGHTSKNGLHTLSQGSIVDRQWVLNDVVSEAQYSPQVGDKVVYLPQGHQELLSAFPESSSPPWVSFPFRWPLVECEVRAVEYFLPSEHEFKRCPSVIVRLTLAILRVPIRNQFQSSGLYYLELAEAARATRNSAHKEHIFKVSLRSCHVPEFVIPSHQFLRSVRNPWIEGMRIDVQYKECGETGEVTFKPYTGTVAALVNRTHDWPGSPWEALEVRWDEAEAGDGEGLSVDRIGLWEATPQFEAGTPYQLARDKFTSPLLDAETCERIASEVDALMERGGEDFAPFEFEVDSQVFIDYYCVVAAPMYVDLVLRRLRGGYYRQLAAVEADVDLIHDNCVYYNANNASIVATSSDLRTQLHRILRPDHTVSSSSSSTDSKPVEVLSKSQSSSHLTLHFNKRTRHGGQQQPKASDEEEEDKSEEEEEEEEERPMLRFKRQRVDIPPQMPSSAPSPAVHRTERRGQRIVSPPAMSTSTSSGRVHDTRAAHGVANGLVAGGRTTRLSSSSGAAIDSLSALATSSANRNTRNRPVAQEVTVPYSRRSSRHSEELARPVLRTEGSERPSRLRGAVDNSAVDRRARKGQSSEDEEKEDEEEGNGAFTLRLSTRSGRLTASTEVPTDRFARSTRSSNRQSEAVQKNSDSSSGDEDSEEEEEVEEEEFGVDEEFEVVPATTSRSGRVVKPPSNFWAESAALELVSSGGRKRSHSEDPEQTAGRRSRGGHMVDACPPSPPLDRIVHRQQPARLDPETKRQLLLAVGYAEQLDSEYGLFAVPVEEDEAPGYFDIVLQPMDLRTVRENITNRKYHSVQDLVHDVLLIYSNCELYNDSSSTIGKEARRQKRSFNTFLNELPSI